MKVVILAGGFGTRISEESQNKPKPMVEIGGMPILWHIMKVYSHYGFNEFVICAGYKQHVIKEWFADYFLHTSDVTFDFTNISGFSSWNSSYTKRTVEYDDATVIFTSANKQSGTITNMPVTKGQPVEIKAKDGATMKAVKFTCKQWTTKKQIITLHYSINGGSTYTKTDKTSTTFSIEHTDLPAGTNAVKITFDSTSNQVGIQQADVTFLK